MLEIGLELDERVSLSDDDDGDDDGEMNPRWERVVVDPLEPRALSFQKVRGGPFYETE